MSAPGLGCVINALVRMGASSAGAEACAAASCLDGGDQWRRAQDVDYTRQVIGKD